MTEFVTDIDEEPFPALTLPSSAKEPRDSGVRMTPVWVTLIVLALFSIGPSAASAAKPRKFHNCAAMNAVYPHGVAKNFKVLKTADGFTARPFVSASVYASSPKTLDRDHDGVECEK